MLEKQLHILVLVRLTRSILRRLLPHELVAGKSWSRDEVWSVNASRSKTRMQPQNERLEREGNEGTEAYVCMEMEK